MKGKRALAAMLIMSILSACAGGTQPHIERRLAENKHEGLTSYEEAVESLTAEESSQDVVSARQELVPAVHRDSERQRPPEDGGYVYDDEEPSPQAQRAAEAALILTGSVFLCTFVVVVLDGACSFGFGFGYHYY
jgi:hypothetical protein